MPDILIVAATAGTRARFERDSDLGGSLRRLSSDPRIASVITCRNRRGLPAVFNQQIVRANRHRILVFTHDDVCIDDYWLSTRLDEALEVFDVVGVAGNRRRMRHQPAWAFTPAMQWDRRRFLSGAVCHPTTNGTRVTVYGESAQPCALLDGVFLAAKAKRLLHHEVRFDEQFGFHFYDLDFCRTAERAGLALGTWPIAVTHASGGSFGSRDWQRALTLYRAKWRT